MQIPHLVELGINAVELLPVFEYDELEFQRIPNPRDHMVNIWGYSHINFFAPMSRYAADGAGPAAAAKEFKQMVQQFHKAGIEVILDVVYNHTAEGDPPCLHLSPILLTGMPWRSHAQTHASPIDSCDMAARNSVCPSLTCLAEFQAV